MLRQAIQGISDLITVPGLINLDFADVRTDHAGCRSALMGIGEAGGENRAVEAARRRSLARCSRPSIDGARGVLINITGGTDLTLFEVNEAAEVDQQGRRRRLPTSSSAPSSTRRWATRCA